MLARYVSSLAFAGHAGEMDNPGTPVVLPFEMWLGLMGLALLLLIAIAWLVGNAFRLRRIDRRLRVLEGRQKS
ncbi:MAG TPA: hypothetical protein VGJ57_10600 [Nitrospirales bacterium]|jgi:hypothetical protein